ncbi:MAG: CinA family nicotinamide mononucleotide deamidase-related protein [Fermentimonas sp.]|nr:CinA family nicotinamide mononucleotide deamidase-related protein [Fermentimonas sp.]
MKVEIITIGDELLIGQVTDTNSTWIAHQITRHGFEVVAISSVGDCSENIIKAIDIAFERADILLLTGGIGPTNDDITKHTLCSYFHTALELNDEVLQNIESIFLKRNLLLNKLTYNQAYVPASSNVIQNSEGTAPILWFEKEDKTLVSLPGVPYEMQTAMYKDVIPLLIKRFHVTEYISRSCIVTGITESDLASKLADFELLLPSGYSLAYLPSLGYISLRLSVWGHEHIEELKQLMRNLKKIVKSYYISKGTKLPEELLSDKLQKKKLTLSTAESCTGGHIAHKITVVPNASKFFIGSIVSYANSVKEQLLNVDKNTIELHGVVSKEVVEQMVINVSKTLNTNCSIAVSGYMGPDGGTKDQPVGTVWIATKYNDDLLFQKHHLGLNREYNIERTANLAILQLIKMIGK